MFKSILHRAAALAAATLITACSGGADFTGPLSFRNFQEADVVIGQGDGTSGASNGGVAATNAMGINSPFGAPDGRGGLYVPDQGNRRVLYFSSTPNRDGAVADGVIGQADSESRASGVSASRFNAVDCTVADGKLFLVDISANRILIWNTLPTERRPGRHRRRAG